MGGEEITVPDGEYSIYGYIHGTLVWLKPYMELVIEVTPTSHIGETWFYKNKSKQKGDLSIANDILECVNEMPGGYRDTRDPMPRKGEVRFRGKQDFVITLLKQFQECDSFTMPIWTNPASSTPILTAATTETGLLLEK